MTPTLAPSVFEDAEFERLEILQDRDAGVFAVVALHSTRLGPAFGGIRRWSYPGRDQVIADALRLAHAMTLKCAVAGVPGGGGKAVLLDQPGMDRERAYSLIGECVADWNGRYYTGPDVGTTADDLAVVARHTRCVAHASVGGAADIALPTAEGVVAGIHAVAERLGFSGVRGAHVVVQGLGAVGGSVARLLAAGGAKLTVSDVRDDLAEECARDVSGTRVDPAAVADVVCDIYAPCALGGVITEHNASTIPTRAVAGAANNVLASKRAGVLLAERGVLYAPDFVMNAGALIVGALTHIEGQAPSAERVEEIGVRVGQILDRARDEAAPPEVIAERIAMERLAAAR